MTADVRLVAYLWHQRSAPLDTRERLLAVLTPGRDRVLLETCHRVELYAALPADASATTWTLGATSLIEADRASMTVAEDTAAAAHLFRVSAGLDSAVAGEPQILRQVRRAYAATPAPHPILARLFERALHVGRAVRRDGGFATERSVGSLAVDEVVRLVPDAARSTVLVIGAGEMGKLAVRALAHRVARVIVANRDTTRAAAVAEANGAEAVTLADLPRALESADAVISAADTRGALLTTEVLRARVASRPLVVVDVAVPRSVSADARGLRGLVYRSVDELPGALSTAPAASVAVALRRCAMEAERLFREAGADRIDTIVALRADAESVRKQKLERALRRLGHLSSRDRRIVEALSTTLTDALLYPPIVALREDRARPEALRAIFARRGRE